MNTDLMFSSKTDVWETPQALFDELNEEFHFTLDACALPENAKCEKFYTPEMDGLKQEWSGNVWCNPPYGREISKWIKKASSSKALVVMLLPARTDTQWFHEYIYGKAEIRFIKGRLKFGGHKNSAPFPSMVVVFRSSVQSKDIVRCRDCKYYVSHNFKPGVCRCPGTPYSIRPTPNFFCACGCRAGEV